MSQKRKPTESSHRWRRFARPAAPGGRAESGHYPVDMRSEAAAVDSFWPAVPFESTAGNDLTLFVGK